MPLLGGAGRGVDWSLTMASKKLRPDPRWVVILEEIRSQNRATIEAVGASRVALEGRFDALDAEVRARFALVEGAIRSLGERTGALESRNALLELALRELKVSVQQNSVDIRDLAGKVEALSRLEERVSALERQGARA